MPPGEEGGTARRECRDARPGPGPGAAGPYVARQHLFPFITAEMSGQW